MTAREVVKRIVQRGGREIRQRGSHKLLSCACGRFNTTVPMHRGEDIRLGTLRAIERQLAGCSNFGREWLR